MYGNVNRYFFKGFFKIAVDIFIKIPYIDNMMKTKKETEMQLIPTTGFDKKLFIISGDYVFYPYNGERRFVGRFKYSKSPFTKAKFLKELIANHTVEGYFSQVSPHGNKAPLDILREKNEDWYFDIIEAFCGKDARKFLNGPA